MANKLNSKRISSLLEALIDTPHWYGETNADNESLLDIDTWGDIAWLAVRKLIDAFDSTSTAPRANGSAIEIRDEVRKQLDGIEELIEEVTDDEND